MAIFGNRQSQSTTGAAGATARRRAGLRLATTIALGAAAVSLVNTRPVAASTDGNTGGLVDADYILQIMGFPEDLVNIFSTTVPPPLVNVDSTFYGYIKNDYIGVVVGEAGTYTTQLDTTHTVTHHSAGMITFGNQKGSLLTGLDDDQGLVGLGTFDFFNATTPPQSVGFGVWPIPNWAEYGTGTLAFDTSAYTRARVDGATTQAIVGGTTDSLIAPRYENHTLSSQYLLATGSGTAAGGGGGVGIGGLPAYTGSNVILDQVVELYRATARMHWRIYNGDSVAHTVTLRFTVPLRATDLNQSFGITAAPNTGFFYVDPVLGQTTQANVIPGANLPDVLSIYGKRYDDPTDTTVSPYASKTIFRGFNATLPNQVWLSDPFDTRPNGAGFDPTDLPDRRATLEQGVAESLYFGPYTMQPGASKDVYTYIGNGRPTEDLRDDVSIGVESQEAVNFNSNALNDAKLIGNKTIVSDPTLLASAEAEFLLPNPIVVQGSVYNRTLPENSSYLTGVTMSLILPSAGLTFTTPPGSTVTDTATKAVGSVAPDTDAAKQWYIQATGTTYGVLTYQLATSSKEIGSRTVSRTISVPAIPLHPVTNTSFQLLGFPFQFDLGATNQADPATIINKLSPSSLQDNPAIFYYWIPSTDSAGNDNGHYAIATSLNQGQGYWFRPAATRIVHPYGAAPVSGQTPNTTASAATSQVVQLSLGAGWNMITNPYLYSIPLQQLRIASVQDAQLPTASSPFLSAANAGLVRGSVFYFNVATGAYDFFDFNADQPTPTLDPWVGYWIYVQSNIILTFPLPSTHDTYIVPSSDGGEPSTRGVLARGAWAIKSPTMTNWTLQLVAKNQNGKGDHAAIVGVKSGVTTKNALLPKPPAPASDYVYIGLMKPNATGSTRYAEAFQEPSSAAKTWDFEVSSDKDGPVTLQWPNVATLPRLLDLSIKDTATGKSYSLHGRSSLPVNLKAGKASRFELIAKQQASAPLDIDGLRVVHVGGTRSASNAHDVIFSLTQDATVTAQVVAMSGKVVSTIESGRAAATGETTLHWSGRSETGGALPVGLYQIKVTARTDDGHTMTRMTLVNSLR